MQDEERNDCEVLPATLVGNKSKDYFRAFRAELEEIYPLAESDLALLVNYCNMQEKIDNLNRTMSENPLVLERHKISINQFMKTIHDLTRQQSNIASVLGLGVLNRNRIKKTMGVAKKTQQAAEVPKLLQFAKKG